MISREETIHILRHHIFGIFFNNPRFILYPWTLNSTIDIAIILKVPKPKNLTNLPKES